jgi:hypothetical protein
VAGAFAFHLLDRHHWYGAARISVLAGSVAYALGETRKWPVGLARAPLEAKAFYGTVAIATLAGSLPPSSASTRSRQSIGAL